MGGRRHTARGLPDHLRRAGPGHLRHPGRGGLTAGARVTLHVWRIPRAALPRALWRVARDRRALRRLPGVRFAKLLGTARGLGPFAADLTRWAALVVGDADVESSTVGRAWAGLATAGCRLDLRPLASRGRWSGIEPFEPIEGGRPDGPVLALTRARLRPTRALQFWRAVPSVAAAIGTAPGLVAAFGLGEAPLGWQGTVSLWRTDGDLVEFAYRHPYHRHVIDQTPVRRWYAEELFARFAVLGLTGDRTVLGGREECRWEEGAP